MAFLGMRGSGDFTVDGQRPKNWRETILYLYPNGKMPLTAMMSMMSSESVNDPEFNWYTQTLTKQTGTITGVYTEATLTTAYTGSGAYEDTLYLKMAEADLADFRIGHQVLLRYATDTSVDKNAKVVGRVAAGASSYLIVELLEADNTSGNDISDATICMVIGNINAEGADMPSSISYDPVKMSNLTQIFRTPLSITRTARKTHLRTGDAYQKMKREALEMHGIEMEKAIIWGVKTERIGANGKPERTTGGIIQSIKTYAPENVVDFRTWSTANHSAEDWTENYAGEDFMDTQLEVLFRYGETEKLGICGSGAVLGINKLVKNRSDFTFTSQTTSYGIKVMTLETPFGTLHLKTHPLFSHEASNRNTVILLEPKNLRYRYIDDTQFYGEGEKQNTGHTRRDSTDEEYLTEMGIEFHHPTNCGIWTGVGLNPA